MRNVGEVSIEKPYLSEQNVARRSARERRGIKNESFELPNFDLAGIGNKFFSMVGNVASKVSQGINISELKNRGQESLEKIDLDRRKMMIGAGAALGLYAVNKVINSPLGKAGEFLSTEKTSTVEEVSDEGVDDVLNLPREKTQSLDDVLDFYQEGRISLGSEKMNEVKNHWKDKYRNDEKYRESLKSAYYNMGEWQEEIDDIFLKVFAGMDLPENFEAKDLVFLAIPESHWNFIPSKKDSKKSPMGATGPYQFTKPTGDDYDLSIYLINSGEVLIDERLDPLKAAEACAKLLKDLYDATGDMRLALSGYNGGFIWKYIKHAKKGKEKLSYEGFLEYLEGMINLERNAVFEKNRKEHKVVAGENVNKIAELYNISTQTLMSTNGIKNKSIIRVGQVLRIPLSKDEKRKLFEHEISGYAENLDYPPRYLAVVELINEGFVDEQRPGLRFSQFKVSDTSKMHVVTRGETLSSISRRYNISYRNILAENPHITDIKSIHIGERLSIPAAKRHSLDDISKEVRVSINRLQNLNPAIRNVSASLPKGYEVRV